MNALSPLFYEVRARSTKRMAYYLLFILGMGAFGIVGTFGTNLLGFEDTSFGADIFAAACITIAAIPFALIYLAAKFFGNHSRGSCIDMSARELVFWNCATKKGTPKQVTRIKLDQIQLINRNNRSSDDNFNRIVLHMVDGTQRTDFDRNMLPDDQTVWAKNFQGIEQPAALSGFHQSE